MLITKLEISDEDFGIYGRVRNKSVNEVSLDILNAWRSEGAGEDAKLKQLVAKPGGVGVETVFPNVTIEE